MSKGSKPASMIPQEVIAAFQAHEIDYPYRSIHIWEEHCTECAFPDCYKTCDLFEPRKDGNCRRFEEGAVRIKGLNSNGGPVVEINFKRWANMFSKGAASLLPMDTARHTEDHTRLWSDILRRVPDGGIHVNGWPGPFARVAKRLRRRSRDQKLHQNTQNIAPEKFLIALYVPGTQPFDATLSISTDATNTQRPYQNRLVLEPGFHQVEIETAEIAAVIGTAEANFISLIPNTESENTASTIYLGFMGFVSTGTAAPITAKTPGKVKSGAKSVKVMVWDLDHTMWDGILVEDGVDNLTLKPGIVDIVKTLDGRGIVNSVASKNDAENALGALKKFGIDEYFVFPQISWNPKSESLRQIVEDFNIGANTVAFIDDQPFERSEVETVLPEIRTYDALDYQDILDLPEFNPEISSESAGRRLHYINEGARRAHKSATDGDGYEAFLRDCDLQMQILQGEGQNIDRIYELTQRTNQMNFSGTRYTRDDIARLLQDPGLDTFSLRCQDKFGDYGTVGFGLVSLPQQPDTHPQVIDLAFSCRVQSKRAEHAFLAWLAKTYQVRGMAALEVRYIPTARNKATAAVFDDMRFDLADDSAEAKVMRIDVSTPDLDAYPWTITHEDHRTQHQKDAG